MSSLKQRAMQCSGHIPASQYVPVYSRPHRANHARWHEEIAPIMPKPTFDDPYDSRTQSIHEAVKQWLDSSPNSVIGPLYRSRSPSTASPASNGESIEQHGPVLSPGPAGEGHIADTPPGESNNERFYDVGSGGLSPQQVSIEHSVALASRSSVSSPRRADRADNSTPWDTYTNRAQDVGVAALPPMQKSGAKSPERVLPKDDDGKTRSNDAVPPQEVCAANEVLSQEEEGTNIPTTGRRGGKKRPLTELKSPRQERLYGLSLGSMSDINSRAPSGEVDTALALVVKDIDKSKPDDTLSCISDYSSVVGAPNVHLKPPRGLEKNVSHDAEQNSAAVARLPPLPRATSARQDRNSDVMKLPPPLPRATSAREDQNSAVTRVPLFYRVGGPTEDTTRVAGGAKASSTSEIVPTGDPEIVENGDKENISEGKERPLPVNAIEQKKPGYRASLKKIDEVGSKNKTSDAPHRLTIQTVLQNEERLAAQEALQAKMKSRESSPVIISNGVAAVAGGYEFRHERSSRRTQSNYSSGGSVASAPNSVPHQYIYKVSPLHHMARKANRSKKQNAVAPVESQQQLKRDQSTKSSVREASPKNEALDEAKLEELRLKADTWENAKNATITSRFQREESRICAWKERKVAKATVTLSKMESDLEKRRAKATEKMQYEVAQAHKKAAEMKAHAEAKRAERAAKAAVEAQVLRVFGRSPLRCFG